MFEIIATFCKEYRDGIIKKVMHKTIVKPWMKYKEVEIIQEILKNLQPFKCLEWGVGYSTIYFPKLLRKNAKWISVDHKKNWSSKIKAINENPNVAIFYVPPNNFPWTDKYTNGDYSDLRDYVNFPKVWKI